MLSKELCIKFSFLHRLACREKRCRLANRISWCSYEYTAHYKFQICLLVCSSILGIWLVWITSRQNENTKSLSFRKPRWRPGQIYHKSASWAEVKRGQERSDCRFWFCAQLVKTTKRTWSWHTAWPTSQNNDSASPSLWSPLKMYAARSSLGIQGSLAVDFNLIPPI